MNIRRTLVFLAIIVTAGMVQAQDFWLIPDFSPKPGGTCRVTLQKGKAFPFGESSVPVDQIVRFELAGPGGRLNIATARPGEKATEAAIEIKTAGTYVAAVELAAGLLRHKGGEFDDYLERWGLSSISEARSKAKKEGADAEVLYSAYAKAVLQAGNTSDDRASQPLGLKLEIVPETDPALVQPGEKLAVRVLFDGKPLENARVEGTSDAFSEEMNEDEDHTYVTRTGFQGIAVIPIESPGTWLVRAVHMIPATEGKDHDWENYQSSLTFRVPPERGFPLTVDSIMRGPELVGYGISQLRWSGDSGRLWFDWRRPGEKKSHTYVVSRAEGIPRRLSDEEAETVPPARGDFTKDRGKMVFALRGDIFLQDTITGKRSRLLQTVESESSPRFTKDEKSVTFIRENNLYRLSLDSSEIVQLTDIRQGARRPDAKATDSQRFLEDQQKELFEVIREQAEEKKEREARDKEKEPRKPLQLQSRESVRDLELSPDGNVVVVSVTERAERAKRTVVPNYVTESGYTEDIPSRTKVGDVEGNAKMGLISVQTGDVVWIDPGQKDRQVSLSSPEWSEDGRNLVVTGVSDDNKDRWYFLVDVKAGKTTVVDHLHDEAWVMNRGFGSSMGWMPDGGGIFFVSERDGYFQLYSAAIDGSGARALTSGKFEVFDPFLSEDKTRFYFTSSEVHPGERHFYSMAVGGGARTRITGMTGNNRVLLSPDEKTAAVIYSYSNRPPELYLMDNQPGAEAKQVTVTPTQEWRSFPWVDPRLITFQARDGAEVYARVYTPEMLESALGGGNRTTVRSGRDGKADAAKRPGVVFVHGAGYAQNVHRYWSSYYREYMFHHILMSRGFVVMDIDYRGSSGYGRDWRTAIYRHMGGKDLDDQVDGARWMAENLNVDPKRIGLYGGSYGGFITLMAMFTEPDVFAAGAALRPVTDWAHYNDPYTSNILNDPQDDAEAYKRSSPIYFAEGLKGALLICHGVVDTNVHFEDTVRLAERLIELRKQNWEVAFYPVENHGFQRADSWADEYRRILKLFETNLK